MTRTPTRPTSLLWISIVALFGLGSMLSGCADDGSNPLASADDDVSGTQSLETIDLDDEFGGLAYTE